MGFMQDRTPGHSNNVECCSISQQISVPLQERRRQAPGLAKVEKAVEERRARIDSLQARINEVQDRIFGAFSRQVGIDNIREHMEEQAQRGEKAQAQKMALAKQVCTAPLCLHCALRNQKYWAVKLLIMNL
jgi:chromosome segregation ATPase